MFRRVLHTTAIAVLLVYLYTPISIYAEPLISPNYHMVEHSIGNSGLNDSTSGNYRINLSVGDTAIDNSTSDNFQSESGSVTTNDPTLTFAVNDSGVDFGSFSSTSTSVATSTFTVKNYTSHGYAVYITGEAPRNGSHEITAMETTGPSIPGQNQFGINLVANTSPESIGANPDHGDFGFGQATSEYGTPNEYRYVSGEAIVMADESSGDTVYTISYIANLEGLSPGGRYTSDLTLICVGTY